MRIVIKKKNGNLIYHQINDVNYLEYIDGMLFCKGRMYSIDNSSKEIRTHTDLINLVERSNNHELKIIEIPFDSIEGWRICCDDTLIEWIAEDHRIWR